MAEEANAEVETPEAEESFDDSGDNWDDPVDGGFEAEDDSEETTEEQPETEKESDDTESDEEPADDSEEEANVAETEEPEAEPEDNTTPDEPSVDEQTQKQLAHEAFKRREAERQLREAKQQREQENLERYLDEAKGDEDLLRERQAEVKEHLLTRKNSEVLERSLEVDMKLAVADLGLKNMDEATTNFVQRRLDEFEATRVIRDRNGNLLEVKGDVYQYLKEEMDSISQFKGIGAREQTKKKKVETAMTIPKASRTPKEPARDSDLDDFDEEFNG